MSDALEVTRILAMSESELLDYVIESPEYLTDRYYGCFAEAIGKRQEELIEKRAARQPGAHKPIGRVEADALASTGTRVYWNQVTPPVGTQLYAAPPAQGIDLGQLREKLTKLTRRNEFISGQSFSYVQLDDVLALIDQRDARPEAKP